MSDFRDARNQRSLQRLERALPEVFPRAVLALALSRPFIPPTPRLAVDGYWRAHPGRADRLARMLAARSGAPDGWQWQLGSGKKDGLAATFRAPPAPYREKRFARGPGWCCVCGQPVYRFGWHADLWQRGPNKNASWHAGCVVAWQLWSAPADWAKPLRRLQQHKCALTGKRLMRTAEIDHRTPLFQVWRERRDEPWPMLLRYWGLPNLQVINRAVHVAKCADEAGQRARRVGEAEAETEQITG
jgi:hypothetical protein